MTVIDESGQLDLVALLSDNAATVEDGLSALEDALNPAIDANPDDKLLMELFDHVTDAQQSLRAIREVLALIEQRDLDEIP